MLQTCKGEGYLFLLDCWQMLPSSTYNSGLGSGGHSWLSARVPWLCSDFGFSWETSAGLGCDEMFWGGGLGRGHGWCPFSQAFWGGLVSQLRLCDSWTRVNLSGLVLCFRNWSLLLAIMIQRLEWVWFWTILGDVQKLVPEPCLVWTHIHIPEESLVELLAIFQDFFHTSKVCRSFLCCFFYHLKHELWFIWSGTCWIYCVSDFRQEILWPD